jgi:deazaflavin-dependent oxidoreductase (nitroreductase family)
MSTDSDRTARPMPGALTPIAPSTFVKIVVRPMTKVLNPLIRKFAGRKHFHMAAQVRHVGRHSGTPYITPVGVRRAGDVAVIALTFGNRSDWSQNVRAAGACSIRMGGEDFIATEPQFLSPEEARPLVLSAFSPMERASLRLLGIKQFLSLRITPAAT